MKIERPVIHVDPYDVKQPDEEWVADWSRHTCWRSRITEQGEPRNGSERARWAADRWQQGDRRTPGRACQECRRNPPEPRKPFTLIP